MQRTVNSRNVAHPYPKEGTRKFLWSMVILPIPHQLQFRKEFSTNEFNFHTATWRDQSLGCCAEHPRGPVIRGLDVVGTASQPTVTRALQWVELPEVVDDDRKVESGDRIPFVSSGVELVSFRLADFVNSGRWQGG